MKFLNRINLKINEYFYDRIKVKQNDTARYLLFNLLDDGVPFSLENKTVRVYGLKPDGTKVFNNLTIINAARGLVELQLTTQMLVKPGCLKLELVIYEATDILSTTKFDIDIISCIRDDSAIESTNEFSALTLGLSKLDEWDKYFKETSGAIEEKYTERLNEIDSSLEETTQSLESLENANSNYTLNIENYLGNIQNTHPKVLYFKDGWNKYKYWMAYTPYPNGATSAENPSIAVSNDMINWRVPAGLTNPLEPQPSQSGSYNSDVHLVYREDTDTLEIWWRAMYGDGHREFCRRTSKDGVVWTPTEKLRVTTPTGGFDREMFSPSIIFEDGKYKCWFVRRKDSKSEYIMYCESVGDDATQWTNDVKLMIDWDESIRPWHMDVIHTELGYEMVVNAYPINATNNDADCYYVLQKEDGTFTKPKLILAKSKQPNRIDNKGIYRPSLLKIDGVYYLFYSCIDKNMKRWIALSTGKNIFALNGYKGQDYKKKTISTATVDNLDVDGIDIVRISTNTTINSIKDGYEGQRVTFSIGASDIIATFKYSSTLALPLGKNYILTNQQRVMDLVFEGGVWKSLVYSSEGKYAPLVSSGEITDYNTDNIDVIRVGGNTEVTINSFTGGYVGKNIQIVIANPANASARIKNSSRIFTGGEDVIINNAKLGITLVCINNTSNLWVVI